MRDARRDAGAFIGPDVHQFISDHETAPSGKDKRDLILFVKARRQCDLEATHGADFHSAAADWAAVLPHGSGTRVASDRRMMGCRHSARRTKTLDSHKGQPSRSAASTPLRFARREQREADDKSNQ